MTLRSATQRLLALGKYSGAEEKILTDAKNQIVVAVCKLITHGTAVSTAADAFDIDREIMRRAVLVVKVHYVSTYLGVNLWPCLSLAAHLRRLQNYFLFRLVFATDLHLVQTCCLQT